MTRGSSFTRPALISMATPSFKNECISRRSSISFFFFKTTRNQPDRAHGGQGLGERASVVIGLWLSYHSKVWLNIWMCCSVGNNASFQLVKAQSVSFVMFFKPRLIKEMLG